MTLMLKDYIADGKEWQFPDVDIVFTSDLDNIAPLDNDNMSIQDTIDAHSHLSGDFQLLLDDDFNVYQFVLYDGDDDFEPVDYARAEHGCTICFYYNRNSKEWHML